MSFFFFGKNYFSWGRAASQQKAGFQLPLFVFAPGGCFDHEPEVQAAARLCPCPKNSTRDASRWLWVPGHMMAAPKGHSFYSYLFPLWISK